MPVSAMISQADTYVYYDPAKRATVRVRTSS